GNDSLGVALRKNSSMPGLIIHTKAPVLLRMGLFVYYDLLGNLISSKILETFLEVKERVIKLIESLNQQLL
ncbi:hypothetical protein, partial [Nostoc sp. DedQUE09]|uniref:hypothetical protein n=1 Tax=Nostoc sp. DedQUE09 TaxID=3075394 RepID=UPI002AD4C67F